MGQKICSCEVYLIFCQPKYICTSVHVYVHVYVDLEIVNVTLGSSRSKQGVEELPEEWKCSMIVLKCLQRVRMRRRARICCMRSHRLKMD